MKFNRLVYRLSLFLILLPMMAIVSCSSEKKDSETEELLYGVWKSTDFEDGIMIMEEFTFSQDNTFKIKLSACLDDFTPLFLITGDGKWFATKDKINFEYDTESIGCSGITNAISMVDVAEIVQEMRKESEKPITGKIISISNNAKGETTLKLEIDGEVSTYTQK